MNRQEVNKEIATQLLGNNGLFLRDGVDDEVGEPYSALIHIEWAS